MFYEREFGDFEITVSQHFDSAVQVRFLLPTISYLDNYYHIAGARDGDVKLYRALKLQFWRWALTLKKYHAAYNNASAESRATSVAPQFTQSVSNTDDKSGA